MKRIYIIALFLFSMNGIAQAERVCVDIPDEWRANIEDLIVDLDTWIFNAIRSKSDKARSGILRKEVQQSISDNETLPAGEDAIIQKHLTRTDYKNRQERNENENQQRP